ncbi:rhomboid family intramembrane serine protease [Facklamia miroungae]|uniref:Rhomboid protease GluP n=1 Tax=Facklamia miroungae TaxID=120956 RepID=A0A1G7V909_9LACT|nr:rhomboid family intramembrane serine protease [Facklamia miroungae]NKZ30273.1 rhomboid family intramembrane serine protease [Facklamia miroungae]SDG56253.1 rhomboid protease GluP [Facklamia miroungae]
MRKSRILALPFITYILVAANLSVFIYMLVKFQTTTSLEALLKTGAKSNELILFHGEWWRLITPTFIHIGLEHLLFNNLSLYFIGQDLEKILGHGRFLLLFLLASFGGNVFSFAFNNNVSAGASTGIFGLFLAYIVLAKMYPNLTVLRQRAINFSLLILMNVITGFTSQGIDQWGHFGGAVYGGMTTFVLGLDRRVITRYDKKTRLAVFIGMILLTVVLILGKVYYYR